MINYQRFRKLCTKIQLLRLFRVFVFFSADMQNISIWIIFHLCLFSLEILGMIIWNFNVLYIIYIFPEKHQFTTGKPPPPTYDKSLIRFERRDSFYLIIDGTRWQSGVSLNECAPRGGEIVIINDEEENVFILTYISLS